MIDLSTMRRRHRGQPEVVILSLIDIMMVLLIFLLSTASTSREVGLQVERPHASSGAAMENDSLLIGIGPDGDLACDGRRIEQISLRRLV